MTVELPVTVQNEILAILTKDPRVKRVILFGSRAKGTNRPNSDIDLCLDAPELNLSDVTTLDTQLDDLLLPWKIDLCVLQYIDNKELIDHIERVGRIWYS